MVFVFFVLMLRVGPSTRAFHVDLSCVLRTYGAQGEQALEVLSIALRTGRNISFADQLFEGMATFLAGILVNWHSARKHNARRGFSEGAV